jgi:DNA mismatch repair protein MutL
MGFRGEALPSIASVSKVTMVTSTGQGVGTKILIEDDSMKVEDYSLIKGTTFTIEELFYNTPARLKFLKTDVTENANTLEIMQRLALGRSDVALTFYIDDRLIFSTSGRGDDLEVIGKIYSYNTARKMLPVEFENYEYKIKGYIGAPEIAKSNRYWMITILNDRAVYMPKVNRSIQEAYNDFIFNSKFPFVILKIEVEHSLVDVNVHPAKREIRLSNEDQLCDSIYKIIREKLEQTKPITQSMVDKDTIRTSYQTIPAAKLNETTPSEINPKAMETMSLLMDDNEEENNSAPILEVSRPIMEKPSNSTNVNKIDFNFDASQFDTPLNDAIDEKGKTFNDGPVAPFADDIIAFRAPKLVPLCQLHKTYIVAEAEDGFYLIDQHAAQERVNYEKFKKMYNTGAIKTVDLLVPLVVNLSPSDALKLTKEKVQILKDIGIEIEEFGINTIKISRVPYYFKEYDEEAYAENVISQVLEKDRVDTFILRKRVIATMACKASIRAGDKISMQEMVDVIDQLFKCENPTCCPHGRPTMVHFTKYDVEKMFKRSGF